MHHATTATVSILASTAVALHPEPWVIVGAMVAVMLRCMRGDTVQERREAKARRTGPATLERG